METAGVGENQRTWIEKLGSVDRRYVFLLMALAVIIPLVVHYTTSIPPSSLVQSLFDKIESLPPGSKILISFDYGPSTEPENQPMANALTRHALVKGHKVYLMALWATGPRQAQLLIDQVIKPEFPAKVYGVDWIHLGYKAGNQGLINTLLSDFKGMYTTDVNGQEINSFPMMDELRNLRDFDLILGLASGFPGTKEWIQFAGDPGHIPVGGGTTAVMAPLLYPYYPEQMVGFLGGLQGAAEYEYALVNRYPDLGWRSRDASASMGPQVAAHLVIVAFIILGNITYLIERRRKKS
ncbi:MAG: hypothetical protein ACUVUU_03645 [bacterium]